MNLENYYIGILLAHPSHFANRKSEKRCRNYPFMDPFYGASKEESYIFGIPTLLKKKQDHYYDQEFSLYENEISYQLGEMNSLGIVLAYVKPFVDCYQEEPVVYEEEEVWENSDLLYEMLSHTYYVIHSKLSKKDAIVINIEEPMDKAREEYLFHLLGEEKYTTLCEGKKLEKKDG